MAHLRTTLGDPLLVLSCSRAGPRTRGGVEKERERRLCERVWVLWWCVAMEPGWSSSPGSAFVLNIYLDMPARPEEGQFLISNSVVHTLFFQDAFFTTFLQSLSPPLKKKKTHHPSLTSQGFTFFR